jgi:SET domain-containing protein
MHKKYKMQSDDWRLGITVRVVEGKGQCLFAKQNICKGDAIGYFEGSEVPYDTMHSMRLDSKIIDGGGILRYLAHACDPNAYFKDKRRWLYARKAIRAGDEVTIDYLDTEPVITSPFVCKCGSPNCRGKIG